ncbi:MAG: hypothetical protein U0574_05360 [Phycisphaerales bacterium]
MTDQTDPMDAPNPANPLNPADRALERLLASMPLRAPSPALDLRIMATVQAARARRRWPLALAAAAALAAVAGFAGGLTVGRSGSWMPRGGGASGSGDTTLVSGTPHLELTPVSSDVVPAGLDAPRTFEMGDMGPVRSAKATFVRTDTFRDPRRGVTIERRYPEERLVLGSPALD